MAPRDHAGGGGTGVVSLATYLLGLACVLGIAAGQVMFKLSADAINVAGSFLALRPLLFFAATLVLYGVTSIGWVLVLRQGELGKIYPLMALAFVFVPLCSHYLFQERFSQGYFIGSALIIAGLVMIFTTSK